MKNSLKIELWKSFHNIFFYLAIAVGLLIALVDVAENSEIVRSLTESTLKFYTAGLVSGSHQGFSLFLLSLPYNGVNFASRLYLFIWPILAAMPFGASYSAERRSGMYNQMISRSSKNTYFISKYIAVFVSGGFVVAMPALADILLNALVCPYEVMDVSNSISSVFNGWFLAELYYTCPWIHALIWCVVLFFLGGSTAGICMIIGAKIRLQVLVMLFPFAVLTVWDVLFWNVLQPLIEGSQQSVLLSPLPMVIAANSIANPPWAVFTVIGVLIAAGFGIGYWQVTKHELF